MFTASTVQGGIQKLLGKWGNVSFSLRSGSVLELLYVVNAFEKSGAGSTEFSHFWYLYHTIAAGTQLWAAAEYIVMKKLPLFALQHRSEHW